MARKAKTWHGVAAAGSLAIGKIAIWRKVTPDLSGRSWHSDQRALFVEGLDGASDQLKALQERVDKDAAEIIEFQLALLFDEEILEDVVNGLGAGMPATEAWTSTMDEQIEIYRAAEDAYMAARAEDLVDLRDRVLRVMTGETGGAILPEAGPAIVVADELPPSAFLELDWERVAGVALCGGSATSHVAILARARGIPLLVALEADIEAIPEGDTAIVDVEAARLIAGPDAATIAEFAKRQKALAEEAKAVTPLLDKPAVTADGVNVETLINLDHPDLLSQLNVAHSDGIGLTRTEFLFDDGLPDEAEQLAVYRRILAWAKGRPVTIRTLDAGGDKPIFGVTRGDEANPFLGVRGLRLSLKEPELFREQLSALAQAAAEGPLKVMLPMVTRPEELEEARGHLDAVIADLGARGLSHSRPLLGIMVEVPAAALNAEAFAADFYSIGSNDLIQYTTACARDARGLAHLARADDPAVLTLVRMTIAAAARRGVPVSLCGDMASEPALTQALLDCGLRSFSVAPAQVGRVKWALSQACAGAARE